MTLRFLTQELRTLPEYILLTMKLLIVVQHRLDLWNVPAWFGQRLSEEFPQLQITQRDNYDGVEKDLREAEIVFTLSLRPEQFAAAPKLRWIHAPSAAVHQLLFPELVNSEVVVTNSSEVHGPVVAEHVMGLIFALAKKIPQAVALQQKRLWGQEAMWNEGAHPREISGATLGLIGVGSIGRRVAQMASAMGMRVLAVREHVEKGRPDGVEAVFGPASLDEMLRQSDYVVVAAPLITATQRLINAERLAVMKPEACLINVGRGAQVDDAALVEALRSRRIAGAALDVFEREPLPQDSPLWKAENLLITPHTAGLTDRLWQRQYEVFSDNLRRYLAGQRLRYVVDKQKGY
jgi:phosphoglycerate dehydrogenase-like enzyme